MNLFTIQFKPLLIHAALIYSSGLNSQLCPSQFYAEFFVHEYRCQENYSNNVERLERAAQGAHNLAREVFRVYRPDFSNHARALPQLELAHQVEEQAADRIGMEIYLEEMRHSREDSSDPMLHFMVNSNAICPSGNPYEEALPAESALMRRLGNRPHSSSDQRLQELFAPSAIREHLGCRINQPLEDCSPF